MLPLASFMTVARSFWFQKTRNQLFLWTDGPGLARAAGLFVSGDCRGDGHPHQHSAHPALAGLSPSPRAPRGRGRCPAAPTAFLWIPRGG